MTKVCLKTKFALQQGIDGAFAVPSGLSSTTAGRFKGTDGEVANSTTGARLSAVNISSSTNASPIQITTSSNHGLTENQQVEIANHTTNTNANGRWLVHVVSATQFTLRTSTGNGVGGASGTVTPIVEGKLDILATPSITGTAHGNWTSADLGRLVLVTNSPNPAASPQGTGTTAGTKKYDNWVGRIIEIISTTQVRLEGLRFEDASAAGAGAVNWTLMACSQFTATSGTFSSDPVNGANGNAIDKHIAIMNPGSANLQLKYIPWRIGTVIDAHNLLVNDWSGQVDSFPTGSSLTWFLHDRPAWNVDDLFMIMHRFLLQCGWNVKGAQPTGTITAGASPVSGDWVTIWDGLQRRTWEWNNGAPSANHTAVAFTASAPNTNATNLANAINGVGQLSATASGAVVTVTCSMYSAQGNSLIFCNSGFSANSFGTITGMTGGADPGQFRGRNNGVAAASGVVNDGICEDCVYFSAGEDDPSNPRRMWLRTVRWNDNGNGNGKATSGYGIDFAMWQGWNPVYSNGTTHNPGNGMGSLKTPWSVTQAQKGACSATYVFSTTSSSGMGTVAISTNPGGPFPSVSTYAELVTNPIGIYGGEQLIIDYAFMGDKNEFTFYVEIDSYGAACIVGGALKAVGINNQRFMVRAAATAGSNVAIDVGPAIDPTGVTAPRDGSTQIAIAYSTNDELQCCGLTVNASAPTGGSFIESDQITNFGNAGAGATNPDGLDYTITVGTLNKSLSIGDIVGEEACPMYFWTAGHYAFGTSGEARSHNAAQHGDATFFDWNGDGTSSVTNGFDMIAGMCTIGTNQLEEVNPNHRGGRWGDIAIGFRNTTEGEFRGTTNYVTVVPGRVPSWRWVPDRSNNWYLVIPNLLRQTSNSNQMKMALGPISQTIARPFPT